jgi:hypothetical protein
VIGKTCKFAIGVWYRIFYLIGMVLVMSKDSFLLLQIFCSLKSREREERSFAILAYMDYLEGQEQFHFLIKGPSRGRGALTWLRNDCGIEFWPREMRTRSYHMSSWLILILYSEVFFCPLNFLTRFCIFCGMSTLCTTVEFVDKVLIVLSST